MTEGHFLKALQRLIVHDPAILHHPAMAVRRILVDTDIGDHHKPRDPVLHRADRLRHDPVRSPRLTPALILPTGDSEQQNGGHA